MTISSVIPVNNYAGNGSTTTFDFDFLIENSEELVVTKSDSSGNIITLRENVDYTIHEIGNSSGSYITFPIAGSTYSVLTSDEVLTLALELEIKQDNQFPQARNFEPPVVEKALDYIIRLIQILNRKQQRSIKVKESPSLNTEELVNNIEKIKANLTTLQNINNDLSVINSVNSNETNINTVAGSITDVNSVAANISDINDVADNETNINAVNSNKANIDTVAGINSDVSTVAGITSNITTIVNNISDISACVTNMEDINNASTNAQTASEKADEANLSAVSALSSENLAKDWATKLNGMVDESEYSSKYYALQSRDSAGINYKELNANVGYIRKDVLDDSRLFNDIKKLNHSTFDLSKFTIVGSPVITNDGIASGLVYQSDYIKTNYTISFSTANSWAVEVNNFKVNSLSSNQRLFSLNSSNTFILIDTDGKIKVYVSASSTGDIANNQYANYTVTLNEIFNAKLCFTGSAYEVWINGNKTYSVNSTTKISSDQAATVYSGGSGAAPCLGEHDLKQFSVIVDGYPVFSGNVTGIDTVKSDDYTVVGTPTISADGVLGSPTTASNYITTGFSYDISKDFEYRLSAYIAYQSGLGDQYLCGLRTNSSRGTLRFNGNRFYCVFAGSDGIINPTYSQAGWYDFIVSRKGTDFTLKYKLSTDTDYVSETVTLTGTYTSSNEELCIGYVGSNYMNYSQIDLNSFKFYDENGNLVYQPCLKIPYTQSKTGSKIVDVAYRKRVQDCYEQLGGALYYTIDEENQNVTLPMGDLSGNLAKKTDGDWINSGTLIASGVTTPTTTDLTYSLSSYLPNDNYIYEVLFNADITTGTTSGDRTKLSLSSALFDIAQLCAARTRSSSAVSASGCCILPVGKDRTITVKADSSNTGAFALYTGAYRRIGTNY